MNAVQLRSDLRAPLSRLTTAADSDTIDLADLAHNVVRGWRAVVAGLVIGAIAAGAVLLFVPPRFTGSSSIVIKAPESSSGSLLSRLSGSLQGAAAQMLPGATSLNSPIETELQILASRSLAGDAVDSLLLQLRVHSPRRLAPWQVFRAASFSGSFKRHRLHFQQSGAAYTVTGFGPSAMLTPGMPASVAGGSLTLAAGPSPASFDVDVYDREEAVSRFQKRLGVTKPGGEVVAIGYSADDSLTAAAVPNLIVRRYLERRHTTDRGINQRKVEFLTQQLDSVELSLTAAERALRREQEASGVIDPVVVGKLELERAGDLRKEAGTLDVERGAIDQMLAQLAKGSLTSRQLAAFPTFLKSQGINDLLSQLSTLETKRLQLLATYTPEDPSVVAATEGIKNMESQLPPLARAYAASLDHQRAEVGEQLDTLRSAIEQLPATSEVSLRLQREVLAMGQVNAAMRAQLVEARLAAIGEGGDVRLLDIAQPPRKVSFPTPGMTWTAGLSGGLLLGLLIAVLGGFYGRYVPDERTIERQIGVPAVSLDNGSPLLVAGDDAVRTLLLVPLDGLADTAGVAERLMRTASSRGLRGTVLDFSGGASLTVGEIDRLGLEFDLVVVRLPDITVDTTVGALRENRPVLLVATAGRVDRRRLSSTVENLQRLAVPCAGVVLSRERASTLLTT